MVVQTSTSDIRVRATVMIQPMVRSKGPLASVGQKRTETDIDPSACEVFRAESLVSHVRLDEALAPRRDRAAPSRKSTTEPGQTWSILRGVFVAFRFG